MIKSCILLYFHLYLEIGEKTQTDVTKNDYFSSLNFCLNTQSVKVWWRYSISDMNTRQLCIESHTKRKKILWRSITCSYIWYVDISKCVYWLDTYFVKVWWKYVLPNTNTVQFCDIIFRKMVSKIKNPVTLG